MVVTIHVEQIKPDLLDSNYVVREVLSIWSDATVHDDRVQLFIESFII